MRLLLFTLVCFFLSSNNALAIKLQGTFTDAQSGENLNGVLIRNLNSASITYSDVSGNFSIEVNRGDLLSCSMVGYESFNINILSDEPEQYLLLKLKRKTIAIDTIVIRSLTKYQQDSLTNREIFGKKVEEQPAKFKRAKKHPLYGGSGSGILNYDAPISSLIQKRTKKYKRLKAFQDRYKNDEKQSYADSRYTPQLVTALTGLTNDSLLLFMKAFPIAYDFSRAATDLELKMWIKYNYKTWPLRSPSSGKP
ncbi:MAG: carboxypeptidase-like regulatory domain-containing protein [Taibaiella sp.]|jgi:hypothetical protein